MPEPPLATSDCRCGGVTAPSQSPAPTLVVRACILLFFSETSRRRSAGHQQGSRAVAWGGHCCDKVSRAESFSDFSAAIGHLIISPWHYPDTDIYLLVSFLPCRQIDGNGGDLFYAVLRCKRNCLLLCWSTTPWPNPGSLGLHCLVPFQNTGTFQDSFLPSQPSTKNTGPCWSFQLVFWWQWIHGWKL